MGLDFACIFLQMPQTLPDVGDLASVSRTMRRMPTVMRVATLIELATGVSMSMSMSQPECVLVDYRRDRPGGARESISGKASRVRGKSGRPSRSTIPRPSSQPETNDET